VPTAPSFDGKFYACRWLPHFKLLRKKVAPKLLTNELFVLCLQFAFRWQLPWNQFGTVERECGSRSLSLPHCMVSLRLMWDGTPWYASWTAHTSTFGCVSEPIRGWKRQECVRNPCLWTISSEGSSRKLRILSMFVTIFYQSRIKSYDQACLPDI
jgi:hypothetical protein